MPFQDMRVGGSRQSASVRLKRLSTYVAVALAALLIAFYVSTIQNGLEMKDQIDTIEGGSYRVSLEAGRVETGLVQLKTLAERPLYVRTTEAIDNVESSYAYVDREMRQCIDYIEAHHSNDDNRVSLVQGYDELVLLQDEYIALCRNENVSDEEVRAFAEQRINPLIDRLLEVDGRIFEVATNRVDQLCRNVDDLVFQDELMASVLMAAVLGSLVLYLVLIRRQHKEEQALREKLSLAFEIAQSANKAKSDFLASMSHDIRTPMNAIVGLTAIAQYHVDDPERVKECLDRIAVSSKHLLSLISDVLDMGKIESGKVVLNQNCFSLTDLIEGIETIVHPPAHAKNLSLTVCADGIRHTSVIGDAMRLEQVLLNLMSNAIKYTPEGGSVRLSVSEEDGEAVGVCQYRFVVSDTGIGMEPGFMDVLFEPFERAHNVATERTEGAGLGMAITKSIVDMMGGSISVESTVGVGSTFTVVVPLSCDSDKSVPALVNAVEGCASQAASQDTGEDESASDGSLSGRVLLVEDNELNRIIATELIELAGVSVEQACDGVEAVDMLLAAPDGYYGMVFMDMQMPRMNGVQATAAALEQFAANDRMCPPIVAMTANAFSDDRQAALSAGMSDFLTKPINLAELEATLRKYLDK